MRARREYAESWEEKRLRAADLGLVGRRGSVDPALIPEPVNRASCYPSSKFILAVYHVVDRDLRERNALKFRELGHAYFGDFTKFYGHHALPVGFPKILQIPRYLTSLRNISLFSQCILHTQIDHIRLRPYLHTSFTELIDVITIWLTKGIA